jgi:putative molybdopterin biosynthesis protein
VAFSYLSNIELEAAMEKYMKVLTEAGIKPFPEEVGTVDSFGRITAEAVFAGISSPHYNACAMDGIAVFARSTFGATETTPVVLNEGTDFVRVDTGDPLPRQMDAVIMIEDVIELGSGAVKLLQAATPWQHVRQIGEDICAGEMILPSSTRIEPAAAGALLAGGILRLKVWKRPVVGLIPTGDEIVSPTDHPREGDIIEFNTSIFSSMLREWGSLPKTYGIVPDKPELLKAALERASQECDLVVVNAGSSAGREDFTSQVIAEMGNMLVHGISIRPGKPTILGIVNHRPVIGVPGYPVSGIIVMEKLVRSVMEHLSGLRFPEREKVQAVLGRSLVSSLKYKEYVRVKLGKVNGRLIATPLNRGAGVVTSFVKADGLLEVPLNTEGIEGGTPIEVQLLRSRAEIENTLVITGSHDPLIDILSDIVRRHYPGEYVSSSHVGSLGGIMAVKRTEAHLAGIHLLDENTGEYNKSYIRRYLGSDKIAVLHCVKRIQGVMTAPGNPENIQGLTDLTRKDVRYVNRQKGSGTRILLDFLLSKGGISSSEIYGYDREEYTHMSVAALIASGSADAGMGILSAARAYRLDFLPLCEEQYDFVLPEMYLGLPQVEHLIRILKSEEFRQALMELGGYKLEHAGEVELI